MLTLSNIEEVIHNNSSSHLLCLSAPVLVSSSVILVPLYLQLGAGVVPLGLLEYTVDVCEHVGGLLGGIDQEVDSGEGVVLGQGTGLLVVRVQSLLQCLHVIVTASDQGLSGDVIGHGLLGRCKLLVVRAATGLVDHATGDATHQQTVSDPELNDGIQASVALLQQLVQLEKGNGCWLLWLLVYGL